MKRNLTIIALVALTLGVPLGAVDAAQGITVAAAAPMAVYRWWHSGDRHWVSIASGGEEPSDGDLRSRGYVREPAPQFFAYLIGTDNMIAIYRWWQPDNKGWITIPDGSPADDQMTSWGYKNKTFQFYAYRTAVPGTVPVYRWWHSGNKDWITIADGEVSDGQMLERGYVKFIEPLFYAFRTKTTNGGYFHLSAPQTIMRQAGWETEAPHTLSVVRVNRGGFRYWGYYGLQRCGGIGIARSNDLFNWVRDPNPLFTRHGERWPSVLLIGGVFYLTYTDDACGTKSIVLRTSVDGMKFSEPSTLVSAEAGVKNQNSTLFRDPVSGRIYLYWYRGPAGKNRWEIRVKSAATVQRLASSSSKLLASAPVVVAAPQVMYSGGTYYLATETFERTEWKTRVLTSDIPDGRFVEIPGNPILGNGSACFFQHNFGNTLHAYYCKLTGDTWTLDYRTADLSMPQ
jgi:hypothetical protein